LMRGVLALGHQRTASGRLGVGFAAGRGPHQASVILNPHTGQLEEARNVPAGSLFFSVGEGSFWNPSAPNISDAPLSSLRLNVLSSEPIGNQNRREHSSAVWLSHLIHTNWVTSGCPLSPDRCDSRPCLLARPDDRDMPTLATN
jgi:hypothetical protein